MSARGKQRDQVHVSEDQEVYFIDHRRFVYHSNWMCVISRDAKIPWNYFQMINGFDVFLFALALFAQLFRPLFSDQNNFLFPSRNKDHRTNKIGNQNETNWNVEPKGKGHLEVTQTVGD